MTASLRSRILAAIDARQIDWEDVNRALEGCPLEVSVAWLDGEGDLPGDVAERVEGLVQHVAL